MDELLKTSRAGRSRIWKDAVVFLVPEFEPHSRTLARPRHAREPRLAALCRRDAVPHRPYRIRLGPPGDPVRHRCRGKTVGEGPRRRSSRGASPEHLGRAYRVPLRARETRRLPLRDTAPSRSRLRSSHAPDVILRYRRRVGQRVARYTAIAEPTFNRGAHGHPTTDADDPRRHVFVPTSHRRATMAIFALVPALYGLAVAVFWGTGDFSRAPLRGR